MRKLKAGLIAILLVMVQLSCSMQTTKESSCSAWATDLNKKMVAVAANDRLEVLLRGIGQGCGAIPAKVQQAAAKAPIQNRKERTNILNAAAKLNLPEKCKTYSPQDPALTFAAKCPVDRLEEMSRNTVNAIDAGTYAFIWVVEDSLKKAGKYTEEGQQAVDQIIRHLFMGFVVANKLM